MKIFNTYKFNETITKRLNFKDLQKTITIWKHHKNRDTILNMKIMFNFENVDFEKFWFETGA